MKRGSIGRTVILSVAAALAVLATLVGWLLCFPVFVVPSASMERTVMMGDHVVVNRISTVLGRLPQRGDVVVYRHPIHIDEDYMHRIVGIPGDRLRIQDKHLYRNGVEVQEPYVQHVTTYIDSYRDNFPSTPNVGLAERAQDMLDNHVVNGKLVVPEGMYFAMGDNRDDSMDSRYTGFIPRSNVLGRPMRIYASSDPSRIGKPVN